MKNVIDFILIYWRELLCVLAIVCNIVLWFVRKRPIKVVDTIKENILKVLPSLINMAELQIGLSGKEKKEFVLSQLSKLLDSFGLGCELKETYLPFIEKEIELILTTPQKKENRK